jgi:hypothetical protein
MSIEIRLDFPARYEVSAAPELPGALPVFYFPGGTQTGGADGLLVKVSSPDAGEWVGVFAFGYSSHKAKSGIYSCPDERMVCVVSRGRGYMARADDPSAWQQVKSYPVMDVRPIPQESLVVFADYTRLTAYGRSGVAWQTTELSWDGIKIVDIYGDSVRGTAWDSPAGGPVPFTVNLRTGEHTGGASPETRHEPEGRIA